MILIWLMSKFQKLPWPIYFYMKKYVIIQNKMILAASIKLIVDSDKFTCSIFY